MAKQANQLLAMGLQNCMEILEERMLSKDDKERLVSYINQAVALTKPNWTQYLLTLWYNEELTNTETNEKYRANVLILSFKYRQEKDQPEPDFDGHCAFELYDYGRIKTLVIATAEEEETV